MKSSNLFLSLFATILLFSAAAAQAAGSDQAAGIDMDDPHRALGRENDVRVDAQLVRETVSPNTPIGVVYQIENFSKHPVAIAARAVDASYDEESRTVTLVLGAEIPPDGNLPQLTLIAPGEKKVFRSAATPSLPAAARRGLASTPRFVQVKVALLRDIEPFLALIEAQKRMPQQLTDAQFEMWLESSNTIFLNTLPVQFAPARPTGADAEMRASF
ncbi:MAG TPA: hypothetical protein VFO89_05730 [Thermoanaerobaculia bacterium]|nr:hypothetical protein [Thermoanaerobaculia bacterium]